MKTITTHIKSIDEASKPAKDMLAALKIAVDDALDKKKKLGQYSVIWQDNKVTYIGDDAPE